MSHTTGSAGKPGAGAGKSGRRSLPVLPALLVLVFLVGGGNLLASWQQVQSFKQQLAVQQTAQQTIAARELAALCTDLSTMARIPPPPGDPVTNPSRAYSQAEHRAWQGLYAGLGCGARSEGHAPGITTTSPQPGGP